MYKRSTLSGIGLQFFADGDSMGGDTTATDDSTNTVDTTGGNNTQNTSPKTFTQEEVNRMLANEKRQGRSSALKALGLNPDEAGVEKRVKAILDSQKSQAEKDAETLTAEKTAREDAEKRAEAAERKFSVLQAGCKKDCVDDVLTLATAKIDDKTDFETALNAVKSKYPSLFEDSDDGTGSGQGHKRQNQKAKPGSLGSRLAQSNSKQNVKKNPYFTD